MPDRNTLKAYREKRDFSITPEPEAGAGSPGGNLFVIQKHAARRLHYDVRLELDGVLKSWAVPKGPSFDPAEKRLAVRTEDHPVAYAEFEGVIPSGYGAGTVMLWDYGSWEPTEPAQLGLEQGRLKFELHGQRLRGRFVLVRMKNRGETRENWLLIKEQDEFADAEVNPVQRWPNRLQRRRQSGRLNFIPPQLAELQNEPPGGADWLHEIKYDGYRIQAHIHGNETSLLTRNGKNWTGRYPSIAAAMAQLQTRDAIIDGELVALNDEGLSDFALLQKGQARALHYYAFDLLRCNGKSLGSEPLIERKKQLQQLLINCPQQLSYSDHITGDGQRVLAQACELQLEGIISKKRSAPYKSGRSNSWIKTKCTGNDEFVIGGFRRSNKPGRPFSSLLLGEYAGGELVYTGRVGTGFDQHSLARLSKALRPLEQSFSPFRETPRAARDRAHWVAPRLVAQIAYSGRTSGGLLRHPSFLGLRQDKQPEQVQPAMKKPTSRSAIEIAGVRLTHPDRIMYSGQGVSKADIARYYQRNGDLLLHYLSRRPLSLVRCPRGRGGDCFYQKHHRKSLPGQLKAIEIEEKSGNLKPYMMIDSLQGLVASAQIGALELHLWGVRADRLERPERIVFDLDPDESLEFDAVKKAALELRDVLAALGLVSFALLTGGKGIHVVVPVQRRRNWPDIKNFAHGLASKLSSAAPQRYVATASKARRQGRVFIDWLRNERGATAVAPYSLRARAGAPVATPVSWSEFDTLKRASQFNLGNIDRRLEQTGPDPWAAYDETRQSVTKARLAAVSQTP